MACLVDSFPGLLFRPCGDVGMRWIMNKMEDMSLSHPENTRKFTNTFY